MWISARPPGSNQQSMKPERFESFLTENEKRIHNYIARFLDVEEDAYDLVQNVFIAFYERLDEIEDKTALAYLYRMAHNMSLNRQKQQRRLILKSPQDFQNVSAPPAREIDPRHKILNAAIQTLPVKLSTVIHLQYYENLSYKDIGTRLNLSVKAVESLLVRAKKLLRKKMLQESGGTSVFSDR